jgi:hypothetical protein
MIAIMRLAVSTHSEYPSLSEDEAVALARGLIAKYGDFARGFAEDCAEIYVKYGDMVGVKIWQRIAGVVDSLLANPPPGLH